MKRIHALLLASILLLLALAACGGDPRTAKADSSENTPAPWDLLNEGELPPPSNPVAQNYVPAADSTATDSVVISKADDGAAAAAPDSVLPANLDRFRSFGPLAEVFNDSNKYQYAAGARIGIEPITCLAQAYYLRRPLVKIRTNRWYNVEPLTHSVPYLVPEAAQLLETIGRNFTDSLRKRNAPGHKIRVTSLLRTAQSIKKLRRVNKNATDSSTHQLGTTFDISYARFDHDGNSRRMSDAELKYILAEVLLDLRRQNKCMVKFERKSPCFHITATGL